MLLLYVMALALALRCLYLPSAAVSVAGLLVLCAISQVSRVRTLHVLEFGVALVSGPWKLGRRIGALARGIGTQGGLRARPLLSVGISLALTSAFLLVLCLANPVLGQFVLSGVTWLWRHLPTLDRITVWLGALVVGLTLLRPSLRSPFTWREDAERTQEAPAFEGLVARNSFVGLNILLLVHQCIDAPNVLGFRAPAGVSTQEYARAGALWITVVLVMINVMLGFFFRAGLAVDTRARTSRLLAYGVIGQAFVLAMTTYERMWLHVKVGGLSNLHFVGFVGATMVTLALASIAYKLARAKSFAFLLRRQLEIAAVALVVFLVTPTQAISARVNVSRIQAGELRPVVHLLEQAENPESAALLLPLLEHPNRTMREGIRGLLAKELVKLQADREEVRGRGPFAWSYAGIKTLDMLERKLGPNPEVDLDAVATLLQAMAETY